MNKTIKEQSNTVEIITLLTYASFLILIMYYHEPWLDEAQAWLIARDSTIIELFGSITHYEGHPPIWFLILIPFAKLGVPFELGIKAINFTFITAAIGIYIFKSPFSRFFRCSIPFTYFLFYQYGVISRPYSLMMLGFMLSALFYKDRIEKPFRFVAALSIICSASAYGMIITAGISIAWLLEIFKKPYSINKLILLVKSRVFYALLLLFVYNFLLLLCIYPYSDVYALGVDKSSNLGKLFYMFYIAPTDAVCSFGYFGNKLQVFTCIPISIVIFLVILKITSIVKKQTLFLIPYLLFIFFGGLVYFWIHHLGIIIMFYIFILWCCFDILASENISYKIFTKKYLNFTSYMLLVLIIVISIYWSISASINDILYNY